ncbi:UDP-glucose/GDP-mannose dehydrogenase family protein [Brevibacillus invocatus]|uniref:UDP-glucose 6-dehydrogenase n=1 Tax=Brevibacillus invocatus TaxID=173959 RepID=A0A3M8CGG9_9BACL|nr:UDP-glucose/GDP-mannose dehydrogenase family protein [Brevibacillus invocatus]RNB74828.1 UDP-glucose/GDP-mannose dehydrogenase family protein [Brevibacillus invocatus]
MKVVCIGAGYVGSVTGTALAANGHQTTVVDIDPDKIDRLNRGESPIYEPGMDTLVPELIGKSLFATSSYDPVADAEVVFIAVGTPSGADGSADLRYIKATAEQIGKRLSSDHFTVIAMKSTVPVGTAELVTTLLAETSGLTAETHFTVVSNPEFLREGYALEDVFFPDRIVIGSVHPQGLQQMRQLYQSFISREGYERLTPHFTFTYDLNAPRANYFETDTKSAELIKYASNAFLAVKISYINELARLCEVIGGNVQDIAAGMGLDSRIGHKFLQVSSGWSGSCFPKDTSEILSTSEKYGSELMVVKAAVESNERMHMYVVEKLIRRLKSLNGKRIGILGLSFKPNTDDARKTQASFIIDKLLERGALVQVHDPQGMGMFRALNPDLPIEYCHDPIQTGRLADAVVLLTHWQEYREIDWQKLASLMRQPYVLDTRNFLNPNEIQKAKIHYEGMGVSEHLLSPDGVIGQ